ncbi:sensor histidine kinase [Brachybacterium hainanense]|uniref:Oxygen sensor histidine kinase NreB n=1 Tax=Brachybacterium hainanense TaxID=1541174 RepID=A0ABV6R9C2_9MICO
MTSTPESGARGILAPVARLDRVLHLVFLVLVATCAARYLMRHGTDATGILVLTGALGLAIVHSLRPLLPQRGAYPAAWVVVVVVLWGALTIVAPSFAWCAVPVAFAVLRVLRIEAALAAVVLMTLVVGVSWMRITDLSDPTLIVGPLGIALVTVMSYQALDRQSQERQRLLDELREAQAELVLEQRRTGALAERARLSREIHDSVGQGLSSITLLLGAAEQEWTTQPEAARGHMRSAAGAAREGLEDVRRVVADLAPAVPDPAGEELVAQLERIAAAAPGLDLTVRVHGAPATLSPRAAAALVATARGAVANILEHAEASRAALTVTYDQDQVILDVRDDGRGFDADAVGSEPSRPGRGHGLRGIADRAAALGGRADVESAPGEGTTVSVRFPLEVP